MGNWFRERFEVPWNWFTKKMVRWVSTVEFLLVMVPIIKKGKNVPAIVKGILSDFHMFLFGASWILSIFSCNVKLKENSSVSSQELKCLGEEELKTLQKEIEELDQQTYEELVNKRSLVKEIEELERKIESSNEKNSSLKRKFSTIVREQAFISELGDELREVVAE